MSESVPPLSSTDRLTMTKETPAGSDSLPAERPLVSVIIPTHNRAALVGASIESVLSQDGVGRLFDLELILVDDASTDATPQVAQRYAGVRYIRLPVNKRVSGARNVGITASRGRYIAFLDDDDMWLPHRLRVQVPILESQPDIGVVYGQGVVINERGDVGIWPEHCPSGRVFEDFLQQTEDIHNVDTWLVRRTAFESAGLFDETLTTLEHNDMALRLAFHVAWRFVPGPMCYGRLLGGGLWVTNIQNGVAAGVLRRVIDRALNLLPGPPDVVLVRNARAAGAAMLAGQLWHFGGLPAVKDFVLNVVRESPDLLDCPSIRSQLWRVAQDMAKTSSHPIADVRTFWGELTGATALNWSGLQGWLKKRALLGDLLAEAAIGLWESNSPRMAAYVALSSVLHDVRQIYGRMTRAVIRKGSLVLCRCRPRTPGVEE